ncbi:CTP synthase [Patescibacteria group bacterium]|nr:CTP synthase [Patescibacteria group bacterium]MDE1946739.1 CTP synthase [Patescibacteria group bacterium]MDE2010958.1 CTP synthase [Patescibacteria group bacterium]MDE2232800.1 CTP synthase [Patescibacteria group bacterium]
MAIRALKNHHKYIFVIGGVMSGVGKGIATSSIGTLLTAKGYRVNLVKVDPYLNVDAGTMNPTEHGEVFVLNSGLETDQDMGNYERFLGRDLTADDYITSGMVYKHVIEKERALEFGGKCVEAIPHIRDEIVHRFEHSAKVNKSDISIIEIGGTIGDYQNVMFIEAARVLKMRHPNDVLFIMVSYLPTPGKLGEMKSRPTQNAARQLAGYGINTDFIIARAESPLDHKRKEKIAVSCNIPCERVISAPDIESIYDVPANFEKDKLGILLLDALGLKSKKPDKSFEAWKRMARGIKNHSNREVNIAIVGKYFNTGDFILSDAYLSVLEAIKFSAYEAGVKAVIHTVNSRDFEGNDVGRPLPPRRDEVSHIRSAHPTPVAASTGEAQAAGFEVLDKYDGIIVPGGFGESGIEGKLNVIKYARENKIPYFGLCYGMQLMTIEYARNVLGLNEAHTAEINPRSPHLIIDIMPDQKKKLAEGNYGGSMRLGLYPAKLAKDTIAQEAYSYFQGKRLPKPTAMIKERHRHRYEVNPKYIERLEKGGLVFSGCSPDGRLMEIAELPREVHPFFLGTQFHPEFLARPLQPHPLFTAFVKAAKVRLGGR